MSFFNLADGSMNAASLFCEIAAISYWGSFSWKFALCFCTIRKALIIYLYYSNIINASIEFTLQINFILWRKHLHATLVWVYFIGYAWWINRINKEGFPLFDFRPWQFIEWVNALGTDMLESEFTLLIICACTPFNLLSITVLLWFGWWPWNPIYFPTSLTIEEVFSLVILLMELISTFNALRILINGLTLYISTISSTLVILTLVW